MKDYGISSGSDAYNALMSITSKYGSLVKNTSQPIVFLFEGAGSGYNYWSRFNAMCVVVKDKRITFISKYCNTIPDFPFNPAQNDGDPMPTIMAGVYSFYTTDHKNDHAALHINTPDVVRFRSQTSYYESTTDAINIHKRRYDTMSQQGYWLSSAGCQLVGKADGAEYLKFCKAVGILDESCTSLRLYQYAVSGKVVIDRDYAYSSLKSLGYPQDAIDKYLRRPYNP